MEFAGWLGPCSLDTRHTQDRLPEKQGRVLASSVISFAVNGVGCASLLLAVITFWCLKVFWSPSLPVVPQVFQGDLLTCTPLHCFLSWSNMVAGPENSG